MDLAECWNRNRLTTEEVEHESIIDNWVYVQQESDYGILIHQRVAGKEEGGQGPLA